jgi:hypothetical protein
LPAISQSVTIVNGDTLICLPDSIARKVIADLEAGDLCKKELASFTLEVKGLRDVIELQKQQIVVKDKTITGLQAVIKEKETQLEIKEKEILVHKASSRSNYWKGLFTGLGSGAGIVLVLTLL